MIDHRYLKMGVWGMSRAHFRAAMSGHLGAALVASYCFGEDHVDLDKAVYRGIERELELVIAGKETWSKADGLPIPKLFEERGGDPVAPEQIDAIADALSKNIGRLRASGHNVIFASLALRALKNHPELATRETVDGIVKLISLFNNNDGGQGHFGKVRGWIKDSKLDPEAEGVPEIPPYKDVSEMVDTVIGELIAKANPERMGFGGLWHLINHTTALIDLQNLGFEDLAKSGESAHRHHLRLMRCLPPVDKPREKGRAPHDATSAEFWANEDLVRDSALLTHRVKTIYGFYSLLPLIEEPKKRAEAISAFRWLI